MSTTAAPDGQQAESPHTGDDYEPPRMKYIAAAIVTLLAAAGLIMLFGGGSDEPAKPAAAEGLAYMDGTLAVVEQDRLVLKPFSGSREITFTIRAEDQDNFDIAHLQSHSSVAIPTRIYYREQDGAFYAVYKEDAPVNSQSP